MSFQWQLMNVPPPAWSCGLGPVLRVYRGLERGFPQSSWFWEVTGWLVPRWGPYPWRAGGAENAEPGRMYRASRLERLERKGERLCRGCTGFRGYPKSGVPF